MISNIRFNEIINTFHKGTFPLAVPLSVYCKMCKSPLTMSWTAEIGSWRSVRPHQCWESWSVQSATYIYFRSFTDDSPENETNLDLNPRLNKVFFLINSEGGVVRKVVVTLHHKHAVGLQEFFFQGKHFSSFLFFYLYDCSEVRESKTKPKTLSSSEKSPQFGNWSHRRSMLIQAPEVIWHLHGVFVHLRLPASFGWVALSSLVVVQI